MLERIKNELCTCDNRQARYLKQDVAARKVPLHKLVVNVLDPGKGVVALAIGCVDG